MERQDLQKLTWKRTTEIEKMEEFIEGLIGDLSEDFSEDYDFSV